MEPNCTETIPVTLVVCLGALQNRAGPVIFNGLLGALFVAIYLNKFCGPTHIRMLNV